MKITDVFNNTMTRLMANLKTTKNISESEIDCYGVGAMMPQELPENILLNNTSLYGV